MAWYLMYWIHPRVHSGARGWHKFIKIDGVPEVLDEETQARARELGRSIWSNEKKDSSDAGETISSPYVVWRSPLEIRGSDLVGVVTVDEKDHTHAPDKTAEYE